MEFLNFIHFTVGIICNASNNINSMEQTVMNDAHRESYELPNIELEKKKNREEKY